jgi:glycosyltransferase involved in cell wall biosynthesis
MHNLTKIKIFGALLWITYPLAWLILYPASLFKKKNAGHLFFFFDRYSIGGAQRVHLDILKSIQAQQKLVYFTRHSPDKVFQNDFYSLPNAVCSDIHFWCNNLLLRLFTVHYYAFYINRHKKAHVFSSNSTFFYDMLPFLKKRVVATELLHNFTYGKKGFEFFGLASHRYLHHRIVVDGYTKENIQRQYVQYGVPETYAERILVIEPGVDLPVLPLQKDYTFPLKVLYAGRGGPQKRVWLINKIAEHFIAKGAPIVFHFAGTMASELSTTTKQHSVVYGEVSSTDKMNGLYTLCHALILTSAYEGFPMVVKEGMARGCVPVVTALGGNKTHLTNDENALLIDAVEVEDAVVQLGIEQLNLLLANPGELLQRLSVAGHTYAHAYFGKPRFYDAYKKLLTA